MSRSDPALVESPEHAALREKLAWSRDAPPASRYINVFMDQNNKCNLRCLMCGFADERVTDLPPREMSRPLFDSIATQLFPLANYVQLSMFTEPFMTADFGDRLARVREFGVPESHIITNGTLLTDRAVAKIVDAQISVVTVSVDGGTKETYEAIRIGARFDQVMANVEKLRCRRDAARAELPRIRFNHVLSRWNVDSFDDFLRLAETMRVDQLDVRIVEPMTHTTGNEWSDPDFVRKVLDLRERYAAFCTRTGIYDAGFLRDRGGAIELTARDGERMTCRRPWDTVAIHPNGDVMPCMAWTRKPFGNLLDSSFAEIWAGDEANAFRAEFERTRPGIDCLYCVIKKDRQEPYDDFFYRMLAKEHAEVTAPSAEERSWPRRIMRFIAARGH